MLKQQKILLGSVVVLCLGAAYLYCQPKPSVEKTDVAGSSYNQAYITEKDDNDNVEQKLKDTEDKLQEVKENIEQTQADLDAAKTQLADLQNKKKNITTVNIFNHADWYNVFAIWQNYKAKEADLEKVSSDISKEKESIDELSAKLDSLKADEKKLSVVEDNLKNTLKQFIEEGKDVDDEQDDIDSINKIKLEKIDAFIKEHPAENNNQPQTIRLNPAFSQNFNMTSNNSIIFAGLPPFFYPVHGVLTSNFGYRIHPISGERNFHSGLDIGVDTGTPVKASNYGLVVYSGWYSGFGNTVILSHADGVYTLYGHNSKLLVEKGDRVQQGQTVALAGSTGYSTGPHCHFSLWVNDSLVNPSDYMSDTL